MGCGYVGRHVARSWLSQGQPVTALTRGGPAVNELKELGITPIIADWLADRSLKSPVVPTCALVAVPHRADERFGEQTHAVGLANLMSCWPSLQRVIVLSTTGVYGQTDGQWVDESSPAEPVRIGPRVALAAEQWLSDHLSSEQATSLRLAGIYGPGRVPLIVKLRQQEKIPVAVGVLNLIHVEDIATAIAQLLRQPARSRLYVLSDGQPVERRQFYQDAARIFRTPPPIFTPPEPGSSKVERSESNKRINPQRIITELSLQLRYENHLAGLESIARGE